MKRHVLPLPSRTAFGCSALGIPLNPPSGKGETNGGHHSPEEGSCRVATEGGMRGEQGQPRASFCITLNPPDRCQGRGKWWGVSLSALYESSPSLKERQRGCASRSGLRYRRSVQGRSNSASPLVPLGGRGRPAEACVPDCSPGEESCRAVREGWIRRLATSAPQLKLIPLGPPSGKGETSGGAPPPMAPLERGAVAQRLRGGHEAETSRTV